MTEASYTNPQLEKLLELAIHRRCDESAPWTREMCRCAPMLVELLRETRDQPVEQIASAVRSLVYEQCEVVDEGGDGSWHCDEHELERGVNAVLGEMEKLRHGDGPDTQVPPLMCG